MKHLNICLSLLTSVSMLTGCASGPKYADYKASLTPPEPGMGRIWFYRHEEFFGDGLIPSVNVDGVPIGRSYAGHFFTADTTAGVHKISATTEAKHEMNLTVTTNKDSYVNFFCVPGVIVGRVIPTEADEATAIQRMQKMTYKK